MWRMLQQPEPGDYVVATGETHSVREFAELAFARAGLDWRAHVHEDATLRRPAEVDQLVGDASLARDAARLAAERRLHRPRAPDGRRRPRRAAPRSRRPLTAARRSGPRAVLDSLWTHRELVYQLTRREVLGRYRGSLFGIAWLVGNPLLMLAVYTLVFGYIFRARWGAGVDTTGEFALVLFCGLTVFGIFSEVVSRAPALILSNPNYVKKVVFPLDCLPWVLLGAALFHAIASLAVLLLANLVLRGALPWTSSCCPSSCCPCCCSRSASPGCSPRSASTCATSAIS